MTDFKKKGMLKESFEKKSKEPQDTVQDINATLNDYNTKIRTSKQLELKGSATIKLPNLSSDPAKCQIGELAVISGTLKICTATDTWTVVGTQT